jgi:hypothetical protein
LAVKDSRFKNLLRKKNSGSGKHDKKIINRETKKYFNQMLAGVFVFLAAFIFLGGYSLYKYLNQAFASASSVSSYKINEERVVSLVFIETEDIYADPVHLKSLKYFIFDKNNSNISVFDIPLNLKVDMLGKYGEEEISKSFALGALNSKNPIDDGVRAVNNVILKIFGFKIDRYVLVGSESSDILMKSLTGKGLSEFLNIQEASKLKKATVSNLSVGEYYSLVKFSESLREDSVVRYSITQNDIEDSETLDDQLMDMNFDGAVAAEGLSISVLNGTNYPGIATFGSRLVTNTGGRVVGISNTSKSYDTSYIVTDLEDSKTLSYLSRVFKINTFISKNNAQGLNETGIERSDITVIVGFDIADSLY